MEFNSRRRPSYVFRSALFRIFIIFLSAYREEIDEDDIGEEPEIKKLGDQGNLEFTRVIAVRKYNQIHS